MSAYIKPNQRITGTVVASEIDGEGGIESIKIVTSDGENYIVAQDPNGMRLRLFIQKLVVVTGSVVVQGNQKRLIVEKFHHKE